MPNHKLDKLYTWYPCADEVSHYILSSSQSIPTWHTWCYIHLPIQYWVPHRTIDTMHINLSTQTKRLRFLFTWVSTVSDDEWRQTHKNHLIITSRIIPDSPRGTCSCGTIQYVPFAPPDDSSLTTHHSHLTIMNWAMSHAIAEMDRELTCIFSWSVSSIYAKPSLMSCLDNCRRFKMRRQVTWWFKYAYLFTCGEMIRRMWNLTTER
jgi:hypothetical protein